MAEGVLRVLAVLAVFVLVGAPVGADASEEESESQGCAETWTGTGSGTNAQLRTSDGYDVTVTGGGQSAFVHLLGSGCVGDVTAKSSQLVFDAIAAILAQAPPLP